VVFRPLGHPGRPTSTPFGGGGGLTPARFPGGPPSTPFGGGGGLTPARFPRGPPSTPFGGGGLTPARFPGGPTSPLSEEVVLRPPGRILRRKNRSVRPTLTIHLCVFQLCLRSSCPHSHVVSSLSPLLARLIYAGLFYHRRRFFLARCLGPLWTTARMPGYAEFFSRMMVAHSCLP
jgi:hypothetical protein